MFAIETKMVKRLELINLNVEHVYNHQMLEIHKMQQNKKMITTGSMIERGNKGKKTSLR